MIWRWRSSVVLAMPLVIGACLTASARRGVGLSSETESTERENIRLLPLDCLFVPSSKVSRWPKVLSEVKSYYPERARRDGRQGAVIFRLVIDCSGKVSNARVVRSDGKDFEQAAFEALKLFQFEPAIAEDRPVAVEIKYTYEFVLDNAPKQSGPAREQRPLR